MSDFQYTEIEPSNNYDISDMYTVDERQNQIKVCCTNTIITRKCKIPVYDFYVRKEIETTSV